MFTKRVLEGQELDQWYEVKLNAWSNMPTPDSHRPPIPLYQRRSGSTRFFALKDIIRAYDNVFSDYVAAYNPKYTPQEGQLIMHLSKILYCIHNELDNEVNNLLIELDL